MEFYNKEKEVISLEQIYRDVFSFPLLKACISFANSSELKFTAGEVPLKSMTYQLDNMTKTLSPNEKYYADGIVSYIANEICIYEASGPYDSKEKTKHNFDFHKALYGLLSCLATTADRYSYATIDTFSKLKLYFIQTKGMVSDSTLRKTRQLIYIHN